jgi:hypothetical protein
MTRASRPSQTIATDNAIHQYEMSCQGAIDSLGSYPMVRHQHPRTERNHPNFILARPRGAVSGGNGEPMARGNDSVERAHVHAIADKPVSRG